MFTLSTVELELEGRVRSVAMGAMLYCLTGSGADCSILKPGGKTYIHSVDVEHSLGVGDETEVDDMSQGPYCISCQQRRPELVLQGLLNLVRLPCTSWPTILRCQPPHVWQHLDV